MFWMKYPLREEKAEGGDGGGAGGAGGGDGAGAGGGAGQGTALTLEAVTALLNTTVNTALNGAIAKIEKRIEKIEKPPQQQQQQQTQQQQQQGAGAGASESEKLAKQEVTELTTRLATLEEERKTEKLESQKRELAAEVKTAIADFSWDPTQGGKDIAFDYFKSKASRAEDGTIMIGDVALAKYVKEQVPRQFKGMLAARQVGGAGAQQGAGSGGAKPLDISEIGVGMSKEKEAQAIREIVAALATVDQ